MGREFWGVLFRVSQSKSGSVLKSYADEFPVEFRVIGAIL